MRLIKVLILALLVIIFTVKIIAAEWDNNVSLEMEPVIDEKSDAFSNTADQLTAKMQATKTWINGAIQEKGKLKVTIAKMATLNKLENMSKAYNTHLRAGERELIGNSIYQEAERYDLDPILIASVIAIESRFSAQALSPKGARGLMQVMPSTANWIAKKMGLSYKGADSLYDSEENIKLGASYLAFLLDKFGDLEIALIAYNMGDSISQGILKRGGELPTFYSNKVISCYRYYTKKTYKLAKAK